MAVATSLHTLPLRQQQVSIPRPVPQLVTDTTATSCTIPNLTNRIEYSVTVVATNAIGDSTPSNVVMATPVAPLRFGTATIDRPGLYR